jgi:hypothetical protein
MYTDNYDTDGLWITKMFKIHNFTVTRLMTNHTYNKPT